MLAGPQQPVAFLLGCLGYIVADSRKRLLEVVRQRHLARHGVNQRQERVGTSPLVPGRYHRLAAACTYFSLICASKRVPASGDCFEESGGAGLCVGEGKAEEEDEENCERIGRARVAPAVGETHSSQALSSFSVLSRRDREELQTTENGPEGFGETREQNKVEFMLEINVSTKMPQTCSLIGYLGCKWV